MFNYIEKYLVISYYVVLTRCLTANPRTFLKCFVLFWFYISFLRFVFVCLWLRRVFYFVFDKGSHYLVISCLNSFLRSLCLCYLSARIKVYSTSLPLNTFFFNGSGLYLGLCAQKASTLLLRHSPTPFLQIEPSNIAQAGPELGNFLALAFILNMWYCTAQ